MASAGTHVTIACKVPNGLFLRLFREIDVSTAVLGGGTRIEKVKQQVGEMVKVNGPAVPFGETPKNDIRGGYALTYGVPADFWAKWWADNKTADYCKNGLIFAYEKLDQVVGEAKEKRGVKSGLEPLNMQSKFENGRELPSDPRIPRSQHFNVGTPVQGTKGDDA